MKKQITKEQLESFRKSLNKRKYFSILLALFTLGVNIFAWFAFSANAGLELDATVAAWDVEFKDNTGVIARDIVVEVTKMKPGMPDFNKTIEIESNSDVSANFSYDVLSLSILGHTINLTNIQDVEDYLENYYPFSVTFDASSYVLSPTDSVTFEVNIVWPYDSQTPKYYQQNEVYDYNESFYYYLKSGTTYTETPIANQAAFNTQRNNLYLIKDDADSFFGMQCAQYEATSGQACLVMNMRLLVEQVH